MLGEYDFKMEWESFQFWDLVRLILETLRYAKSSIINDNGSKVPVVATLTHKQLEIHGCILNTVATDGLVLKHQAISSHIADQISHILDWFQKNN